MVGLHYFLDRLFHRTTSFSVFFRLWLSMLIVIGLLSGLSYYRLEKTIRPSAKRVVEDTLVDSSRLLGSLLVEEFDSLTATGQSKTLERIKAEFDNRALNQGNQTSHSQWYDQKKQSQLHLYITDDKGVVLYDSLGESVGKDFSRWNDVYLTLQGKYGARSTKRFGLSVMYVASPIIKEGRLVGVVSIGKPTHSLDPYLKLSKEELVKIFLTAFLTALAASVLLAMWFRYSIHQLVAFTDSLAKINKPHFYLAKEFNALADSIDQMKDTIENRAYVSEFVHTLTHELKSPLSAIRASSELLADEIDETDRRFFAKMIGEQSVRMTALIERLLTLAKLEQPSVVLQKDSVQMKTLCQTLIDQNSAILNEKKLNIHLYGEGQVSADVFWLSQAVQNLLDNAIKHAKSLIVVVIKDTQIVVANDGAVLPKFVIDRAFERYFSHDSYAHKGTGLGLPLVASVMDKHGGTASLSQMDTATFNSQFQPPAPIVNEMMACTPDNLIVAELSFSKEL